MIFSFNLRYGGTKTWIEGVIVKQEDGSFLARSIDLFPDVSHLDDTVHKAAKGYQEALRTYLVDNPDAQAILSARHREQAFNAGGPA